ncbi:NUDIX domain-containing protein [Histidinibacterium lentulum]|uniref:NUDIX hydrolase n=1 Tax=Histidinibacterium lentulum TaxID=2480588 RepID=A0A3N2R4U0_9RHOB|nr:NUDIX hydrolase [Histidinibacterium lentulum]ROU02510.1 NUDIX hydrolase [Histidinibacterium lentulum]
MSRAPVRLAVRAVLMHGTRLLLVNAYAGRDDLWCAPGGGAEPHQSLPDNLRREVREETGLQIAVGAPCLVNEFHDPEGAFHQVDIYFRCTLAGPAELRPWTDPEGIVSHRRWVTEAEARALRIKPDSLPAAAWPSGAQLLYDPLEPILR